MPAGPPDLVNRPSNDLAARVCASLRPNADHPFEHLRLLRLRFTIGFNEAPMLGPFPGPTLRGAFGESLQHLVCVLPARWPPADSSASPGHRGQREPRESPCRSCWCAPDCAMALVFEASQTARPAGQDSVSPPFVVCPARNWRTRSRHDTTLTFEIVLIGKAIVHAPVVSEAAAVMASRGVGGKRPAKGDAHSKGPQGRLLAVECLSADGQVRWSHPAEGPHAPARPRVRFTEADVIGGYELTRPEDCSALSISFVTPTLLSLAGGALTEETTPQLTFGLLFRSLRDRIAKLSMTYHGLPLPLDPLDWQVRADEVRSTVRPEWVEYGRRSSRSDNASPKQRGGATRSDGSSTVVRPSGATLKGLVGTMYCQGSLGWALPMLRLGALMHVGGKTAFGCGRFEVTPLTTDANRPSGPPRGGSR